MKHLEEGKIPDLELNSVEFFKFQQNFYKSNPEKYPITIKKLYGIYKIMNKIF